ncbi:hypothetical protein [Pedobacter sp. UBA5917]|jgi:hypothetical protein|uniref:hypothetical protein n=1 Tax=Pedobacter sp. UBA5917 TaxID=1947061 RepID=UPI0025CD13C0|nr:hypothetical protein [Pedobacter sp. UBA5917]
MTTVASELIERMLDNSYRKNEVKLEGLYESIKTESWKAYEEAREINRVELFEELYFIIENGEPDKKHCAYFLLGYNAKNTNDINAKSYLLKCLDKERNTAILILLLNRLADFYKPYSLNTDEIYKLTNSRNSNIRRAAFEAVTNSEKNAEHFLTQRLSSTINNADINSLINALMYIGTTSAIPYIEPHLKHRKPEIKGNCLNVLTVIMLREGFTIDEIHRKLKVSISFINTHLERLASLTRLGA